MTKMAVPTGCGDKDCALLVELLLVVDMAMAVVGVVVVNCNDTSRANCHATSVISKRRLASVHVGGGVTVW